MKQMKKIGWLIVALFLCHGVLFAQKEERKSVRAGNKLFAKEQLNEAEIAYRKSMDVNPRSLEGNYNLGNVLYKQEKYEEAAKQYEMLAGQAQQLIDTKGGQERAAEVFHNMGNIGMKEKDYAKSIELYKQSLRLNPDDEETRYNLALAQKLLEDQQNEDQDQDDKEEEQEQNQDQNQDQQQQQQNQDDQKEDKTQEEQKPNEQMSQDNAQQILDAFLQDEKDTQEKVKKAQQQQQQRRKTEKEW
ncbi:MULTISPECIES: tetratricopeptide repeat protein [unclassified Parabacteroides]|uniref:tetratricopeptide repeat protein n=1 Tax=unclassified Parabacteroides TaxID=2649774 RepID=UPI0024757648|nr:MULTISPECIES: tetratricopeptide repeat protein [unclassified Parabacteroides]